MGLRRQDDADTIRQRGQRAAWDAYYGRFPKPLKTSKTGNDDNILVNRCRPIADKGVSFLFGQAITFEYPKTTKKKAVKAVEDVWSRNRQATLLHKLALNAAVTGQIMLKLIPQPNGVRMVALDPTLFTVECDPDDIDRVLSFTQTWQAKDSAGEPITRRQITAMVKPDVWVITDQYQAAGSDTWAQIGGAAEWPFPFAPIVTGQNLPAPNQFWGMSDLGEDVIQLNKDLNFIYSLLSRIIRFYGFPKTVGKGFDGSSMKTAADGTLILPSPESDMKILEMHSDLSPGIHMLDEIRSAMDELSRIPSVALGTIKDIPKGTVSGVALQVLYQPLLEKTHLKQTLWEDFLVEVNRRLLVMLGFAADDCIIHWPNIVPTDEAQTAQIAQIWETLGVSNKTVFVKLGLDPDIEQDNIEAEAKAQAEKAAANPPPPPPVMPPEGQPKPGTAQDANALEKTPTEKLPAAA